MHTLSTAGRIRLHLVNPMGKVELQGWSHPETLYLLVTERARTEEAFDAVPVEVQTEGETLRIQTRRWRGRAIPFLEYVLYVPQSLGLGIVLDQGVGDIHIRGYRSDRPLKVELGVGRIRMEGVAAPAIRLEIGIGEAELTLPSATREVRIRLRIGDLHLRLPRDSSYSLRARVGLGDLDLEGFPAMRRERGLWSSSAEAVWGAGTHRLELQVGVGSLRVSPIP